jgi:hypothetical protein
MKSEENAHSYFATSEKENLTSVTLASKRRCQYISKQKDVKCIHNQSDNIRISIRWKKYEYSKCDSD